MFHSYVESPEGRYTHHVSSNMAGNGKTTIEIDDCPIETSIDRGFSTATFDLQRVNDYRWMV